MSEDSDLEKGWDQIVEGLSQDKRFTEAYQDFVKGDEKSFRKAYGIEQEKARIIFKDPRHSAGVAVLFSAITGLDSQDSFLSFRNDFKETIKDVLSEKAGEEKLKFVEEFLLKCKPRKLAGKLTAAQVGELVFYKRMLWVMVRLDLPSLTLYPEREASKERLEAEVNLLQILFLEDPSGSELAEEFLRVWKQTSPDLPPEVWQGAERGLKKFSQGVENLLRVLE